MSSREHEKPASDDTPRPYHHGDLRRALMRATLELVAESGCGAVSLREAARRSGVTHGAPYRHFADKEALVAAVAEEGFVMMRDEMRIALAAAGTDPLDGLRALTVAYVSFAAGNGAYMELMFAKERPETPTLQEAKRATLMLLVRTIREAQKRGLVAPGDPVKAAVPVWAMAHGLSAIYLRGYVGETTTELRQTPLATVAEFVTTTLVEGLRVRLPQDGR